MNRPPPAYAVSPTRGEWLALSLALGIAHAFYWRIVLYPSDFDARNYLDIAQDIVRQGLFSKFFYSNVRTYGYPLFLAFLRELAGRSDALWGWLVFETQLGGFLLASWALRRSLVPSAPRFARWTFIALALNPFVLSYTPETLSESVALTLVVASAACWVAARNRRGPWSLVLVGTLLVSFSVMVRPANVFALAAWIAAIILLLIERRARLAMTVAVTIAVILGVTVPAAPQLRNNIANYGEATPLVVARLATNQQIWGIQYIKYATALPPVPLPSVFYDNPLASSRPLDPAHPLRWYLQFPLAGVATLALHVFNLVDQDLLFTYSRDLDPWYRIPVGIVNHALLALALVGYAYLARHRAMMIPCVILAVLVVAHLAVHAPTAVEMRFGLPLLALAGPLAVYGVQRLASGASRGTVIALLAMVALYVAGALTLSDWVRSQSPSIVAWRTHHS